MVASWLSTDVTPAQLDSAIQQHIHPKEIHWSQQPDTLHLLGHTAGHIANNGQLPIYFKETFFNSSSYYNSEIKIERQGVAGDPVPYTLSADNIVTGVLLIYFVLTTWVLSFSKDYMSHYIGKFFHKSYERETEMIETSTEVKFQFLLTIQTCLLIALLAFSNTRETFADNYIIAPYQVIGLFALAALVYYLIKAALYNLVNGVFYSRKQNQEWNKAFLFLACIEGFLLFPIVLLQVYFGLNQSLLIILVISVFVLVKLLTIFKVYLIFFYHRKAYLQIILYLCTLEIVPLGILWGIFSILNTYMKVIA